jgi:hypothetical protein
VDVELVEENLEAQGMHQKLRVSRVRRGARDPEVIALLHEHDFL